MLGLIGPLHASTNQYFHRPNHHILAGAIAVPSGLNSDEITFAGVQRALPNAPDGYVPTNVSCPASRPTVRSAAKLSSNETSWLEVRRNKTLSAMKDFFGHVKVGDYDVVSYLDKHSGNSSNLPNIGIAVSGGGWRALMNGAGAIKAFDSRTYNASTSSETRSLRALILVVSSFWILLVTTRNLLRLSRGRRTLALILLSLIFGMLSFFLAMHVCLLTWVQGSRTLLSNVQC